MLTKTQLALVCSLPTGALLLGIILCIALSRRRSHRPDVEKVPVVNYLGASLQVSRTESNSALPRATQAVSQHVQKLNNILVTPVNKVTQSHNSGIDPYGLSQTEYSSAVPRRDIRTAGQHVQKLNNIFVTSTDKSIPLNKSVPLYLSTEIISMIAHQGGWSATKALRPVSKRCQHAAEPIFKARFHTLWLNLNNASTFRFIGIGNMEGKFQPRDLVRRIIIATGVEVHEEDPLQQDPHIVSAAIARFRNCTEIEFVDVRAPHSPLSLEAECRSNILLRTIWKGIAESGLNVRSIEHSARRGKSGRSTQPLQLHTFMATPIVREDLKLTALTKLDLLVAHTKLGEDEYMATAIGNMPYIEDFSLRVDKLNRDNRFGDPHRHLLKIKFVDSLFRDLAGKLNLPKLKTLHVETPIDDPVHLMTFIGRFASMLESLSLSLISPRHDSLNELIEMFGGVSQAYLALRRLTLSAYYYHLTRGEVDCRMGWTSDEMVSEEKRLQFVGDVTEALKDSVKDIRSKWFPEVDEDNWQGLIV